MSPELILENFHKVPHSSNFDIKYLNQPSPVQSSLLSASVLGQQAGQGLQSVDHHFHFHGLSLFILLLFNSLQALQPTFHITVNDTVNSDRSSLHHCAQLQQQLDIKVKS